MRCLAVGAAGPAGTYTVSGIPVDVTAADAATARDQAIVEGQRAALQMLVENMMGAEKAATDPVAQRRRAIRDMVQDFEVESERLSSVRYVGIADLPLPVAIRSTSWSAGAPAGTLDTTTMPHARRAGAHHHGRTCRSPACSNGWRCGNGWSACRCCIAPTCATWRGRGQARSGLQRRAAQLHAGAGAASVAAARRRRRTGCSCSSACRGATTP